jgi:hypothetical protein
MTVKLNHTIVAAHDHAKSALFMSEILGLMHLIVWGHSRRWRWATD